MVTEIRIYYEGDVLLKPGFAAFFTALRDRARERRCGFKLIAGEGKACRDFNLAIRNHRDAWNILLKDSEGPGSEKLAVSLCRDNSWPESHAGSIFWMVEMMESWFHADKDALSKFYGNDFNGKALKPNPRVEEIPKRDLESGLRSATRKTPKGDYYENKTSHGPKLLERIDPKLVQNAAPNCKRLFDAVLGKLS